MIMLVVGRTVCTARGGLRHGYTAIRYELVISLWLSVAVHPTQFIVM